MQTDPSTGEILPNYTMLTVNCDGHPLLGRLHRPDPKLPDNAQDKRSLVPLEPDQWAAWLHGSVDEALGMLTAPEQERFDPRVAAETDAILSGRH